MCRYANVLIGWRMDFFSYVIKLFYLLFYSTLYPLYPFYGIGTLVYYNFPFFFWLV